MFSPCAYFPERMWRFVYLYADEVSGEELDGLLEIGFRKFGNYFFRPHCETCWGCIPLRILVSEFRLTKSQRRVARICSDIEVRFADLEYRDEIFEIYREHSLSRFGRESDRDEFLASFYARSCPGIQSEYYLDGRLIAAGFIDRSKESLSSVYFVFNTAYERYRLGTYSVIKEVEHAASLGLSYYYLGYYIEKNHSMAYKGHFHPHETMDWPTLQWRREGEGAL